MNRDHILEIADDIEANGTNRPRFDMGTFFEAIPFAWKGKKDWCNTSGCIAGYVCTLKLPDFHMMGDHECDAARWLGLSEREATDLFYAHWAEIPIDEVTAEMAVVCLRNFAETGKVDWAAAVSACRPELVEEFT